MTSVFDAAVVARLEARIVKLAPSIMPHWGRMTVDQMLAHCNVSYDMVYTNLYPMAGALRRWVLATFVKPVVVGPKPYRRNAPTPTEFRIDGHRDFFRERRKLVAHLRRVQEEGAAAFDGRVSPSFGPLTATEWDVLFHKHLDHHLAQFGV